MATLDGRDIMGHAYVLGKNISEISCNNGIKSAFRTHGDRAALIVKGFIIGRSRVILC